MDPQQAFEELKSFVAIYDPISLLSQLVTTFLFVPADEFRGEASTEVIWQRWIEFLAALVLIRGESSEERQKVVGSVLERAEVLLEQYFAAVSRQLLVEATGTGRNP